MEQAYIGKDNSLIKAFDIDTLNRNIMTLYEDKVNFYDKNGNLIKNIHINKEESYASCLFYDSNKIALISDKVPNLVYSIIDTSGVILHTVKSTNNPKKEFRLNIPSYCIGIDSNTILYKNVLNDTIYRLVNNKFEPYLFGEIGKHKLIYKGKDKFKENARFKVLNIWHINNYWFIQYNYWFKFKGKFMNWTGRAILDKGLNVIDSDRDSYIKGRKIYLDPKLDMFVNKENTTFYQVYKKTKSKAYVSDQETPDSICINYFKVK